MSASKRSSSTEQPAAAPAATTDEQVDAPAPGEPVYRMLADAYGLKHGDVRTAQGLARQGVTPAYLLYRQFAELVKPEAKAEPAKDA